MTVATATLTKVPNFINGQWIDSGATEWIDVTNPATGEVIAQTPLGSAAEVSAAVEAASPIRMTSRASNKCRRN